MNTVKLLVMIPLAYFLFFVLVTDFSVTIPKGYARLVYKNSLVFKVYSYIADEIPSGSKIANDHFVAIPPGIGLVDCDYWSGGCGKDYIEEFKPDYVIFSEDWKFNGETVPASLRLKKYISDHDFTLIDTIVGYTPEGNLSISVWKKPDP